MNIAILGAGGVGLGMAALAARRGCEVGVWARDPAGIQSLLDGGPLVSSGVLEGEFRVRASLDIGQAVRGADLVVMAVPGYGHKAVIDLLVPHIDRRQLVAISSHMSLSALYLSRQLSLRGSDCKISAWATTAANGRRTASGQVHLSTLRKHIVASTVRSEHRGQAAMLLAAVFGDVFTPASDVMAVTLTNVNPATHLALTLCNLTRMEYREAWGLYHGISGTVGRLIEALDVERLQLASRLGLSVHTVQDHLHESFGLDIGSVAEMAAEHHIRRNGAPSGPTTLDHRYVTEDVPFGIVPLLEFGRIAGVEMRLHQAGLDLISALYGRTFNAENNILPHLELGALDGEGLLALCRTGYGRYHVDDIAPQAE